MKTGLRAWTNADSSLWQVRLQCAKSWAEFGRVQLQIGGGAFTIFRLLALSLVSYSAVANPEYDSGIQLAHDKAPARGIIDRVNALLEDDAFELQKMEAAYDKDLAHEPSVDLETTYYEHFNARDDILAKIEGYSHYGIFTFIDKYYANWVNAEHGRSAADLQEAMIRLQFPLTDDDLIFKQFENYRWEKQPEALWQFCRERYSWAKEQWPNLSGRLTMAWTLQELGLIPDEVDIKTIISVNDREVSDRIRLPSAHGIQAGFYPALLA